MSLILLLSLLTLSPAALAEQDQSAPARNGTYALYSEQEDLVISEYELPVNPYSEKAQRQPDEVTAVSADVTVSGAGSTVTGTSYRFTTSTTSGTANRYEIWIWKLENNAYSTVYMTSSQNAVNEYVFYDTGSFRILVDAYSSDTCLGSDSINVMVSAGAAGTTIAEKVASVVSECRRTVTGEYKMALWLHDWLTGHANYDYDYSNYGADGVLMRASGVCDSYSRAYVMLLNAAGIENQRITGTGNGGNHAWNLAKIDGTWCQIDCTWDDPGRGGYENHDYFGITDAMMARDHAWSGSYPACTSLNNYYYIRLGFTPVSSDEELNQFLTNLAENKQTTVKLCYVGVSAGYNIRSAFTKWVSKWNWKYGIKSYSAGSETGEYHLTYGTPWAQPGNQSVPDFTFYSPNGRYTLDQYLGNNGLVLVFGRDTCGNTQAFLRAFSDSLPQLQQAGVDVLVSLDHVNTQDAVREMEDLIPGYRYCYDNSSLMYQCLHLVGISGSFYFPFVLYMDRNGTIVDFTTGYVYDMDEARNLALSLQTGNPIPESIKHADYSAYEQGSGSINNLSGGTILSAVREAMQSDYVYLVIDYNADEDIMRQYEENYALYSRLGLKMVASFVNESQNSSSYPHVKTATYDNDDFFRLLRAGGIDTYNDVYYQSGLLINPEGEILTVENGGYPNLNDCAGYLASKLVFESTIPQSLSSIRQETFAGAAFTSVDLDNGKLKLIAEKAFAGCEKLCFVHIPESVTSIDDTAFQNCDNLIIVCTIGSEASDFAYRNGFMAVYN